MASSQPHPGHAQTFELPDLYLTIRRVEMFSKTMTEIGAVVLMTVLYSTGARAVDHEPSPKPKLIAAFPKSQSTVFLRFAANSKYLMVGTDGLSRFGSGSIVLYDVAAKTEAFKKDYNARVISADISTDGRLLALSAGTCMLVDLRTKDQLRTLPASADMRFGDAESLYLQSQSLVVLDAITGDIKDLLGDLAPVASFTLSRDASRIAAVLDESTWPYIPGTVDNRTWRISVWDVNNNSKVDELNGMAGFQPSVVWNSEGSMLFVGGSPNDRSAFIWELSTGKKIALPRMGSLANRFAGVSHLLSVIATEKGGATVVLNALDRPAASIPIADFDDVSIAAVSENCDLLALGNRDRIAIYSLKDSLADFGRATTQGR